MNILRTPLWGRAFETFGEDPYLTARLGVAWIRAAQGEGVIANVKHFAVNNQEGAAPAGGTAWRAAAITVDARVGERTLREIYLPQFEAAVKEARVGSVMCSYNRLNGPHACENRPLLTRILRRDWGFKGFVLADYGASKHVGTGLPRGAGLRAVAVRGPRRRRELTPRGSERRWRPADRPRPRSTGRCAASCARCSPTGSSTARPTPTTTRASTGRPTCAASREIAEGGTVAAEERDRALPLDARGGSGRWR